MANPNIAVKFDQYEFRSPLSIEIPRKTKPPRKIRLNMNVYRNLHYITNNQAKVIYCELMRDQLRDMRPAAQIIAMEFELFKASNRKVDRSNILSIVEKFFCDALIEHGKIPDDDDSIIRATLYTSGGIDRESPHVKVRLICKPLQS